VTNPPIVKSLDAEHDLADLFDYIALDSGVERAETILRRIDEVLANLAIWPRIGRVHPELDGSPRVFATWPWLIVYEPQPDEYGIFVWRIIDGRCDIADAIHAPER
jgi:plasmid stabilization system protein ParE